MDTYNIKVTWKAFEKSLGLGEAVASVAVSYKAESAGDIEICEQVFQDTNKYRGSFWDLIEPVLPDNRTHTALSVGDEVEVNGIVYRCEGAGWEPVAMSQ